MLSKADRFARVRWFHWLLDVCSCLSFVLRWAFCILPLPLLLPIAVCASAPTQPAAVAGYWCLGCFFWGVRTVPWPLVHSPSFLQAPACLVITLGRWTEARLPWWPPCCWGECCLLHCYLYGTYPQKYWRGVLIIKTKWQFSHFSNTCSKRFLVCET